MGERERVREKEGNKSLTLFVSFATFLSALVFHVVAEISASEETFVRDNNKART